MQKTTLKNYIKNIIKLGLLPWLILTILLSSNGFFFLNSFILKLLTIAVPVITGINLEKKICNEKIINEKEFSLIKANEALSNELAIQNVNVNNKSYTTVLKHVLKKEFKKVRNKENIKNKVIQNSMFGGLTTLLIWNTFSVLQILFGMPINLSVVMDLLASFTVGSALSFVYETKRVMDIQDAFNNMNENHLLDKYENNQEDIEEKNYLKELRKEDRAKRKAEVISFEQAYINTQTNDMVLGRYLKR